MTSDFEGALKFVLDSEGGYSDDVDDPGGATNLGIEQREYDDWRRNHHEAIQNIKLITVSEAAEIYKANYWETVHGDYLVSPIAWAMFDTAVNMGCSGAIKDLQICLNIDVSEVFDTATSDAYHGYVDSGRSAASLANDVLDHRVAYYRLIAHERPALNKFLEGWLARVERLRAIVNNLGNS